MRVRSGNRLRYRTCAVAKWCWNCLLLAVQVIDDVKGHTLASASTVLKDVKELITGSSANVVSVCACLRACACTPSSVCACIGGRYAASVQMQLQHRPSRKRHRPQRLQQM